MTPNNKELQKELTMRSRVLDIITLGQADDLDIETIYLLIRDTVDQHQEMLEECFEE